MNETFASLTPAQHAAIDQWQTENNPNGDDFEYADNDRVAVKGNAEQEAAYEDARMGGCCGSVDVELTCADGSTIMYGFNYGH